MASTQAWRARLHGPMLPILLVVTLVTLGLMYPWALVRQQRYVVQRIAVSGPSDLQGFVSTAASQQGAIGEEVAGFFDIDFGL